ncbi:hypothetical protein [Mucilaginibacter kameinonensis]|uniref:hypothetical protein n=1 Tax=Mucilaginibacter kameinonensis TaxID=452286 RepID=UPI0013CE5C8D|nr:hypothetical protein [Mucilaginibacter kameinonensis]
MKTVFLKFLNWVKFNFRPLFLVFAAGLLTTAMLTQKDNYLVITANAPKAILSWETNLDNLKRDRILKDWSTTYKNLVIYENADTPRIQKISGLDTVIAQNSADYGFIIFYMGILLLMLSRLVRTAGYNKKWAWVFIMLAVFTVLAGLLDYAEDFGTVKMLRLYADPHHPVLPDAGTIGYPARIKWLLILVVVIVVAWQSVRLGLALLWLGMSTDFLKKGVLLGWRWRVIVLTLLIVFAVLYISDQGQDLLLSLNADKFGVVLFLFSTSVIALLSWYLPKILEYTGPMNYAQFFLKSVDFAANPLALKKPRPQVDFARLLGAAGFLIPAIGILKVMDNYHIDYWFSGVPPLAILVIILVIYRIVLEHHWIDRFYKNSGGRINRTKFFITLIVLLVPVLIWGMDKNNIQPYAIVHLALDLIIFSVLFLIITTLRTCSYTFKNLPVAPVITLTGFACLVFFIACNFPGFLANFIYSSRFYTMPFVFFGIAGYLLFFTYLIFVGRKTGVTWITLLLMIAFVGATTSVTNFHGVAVLTDTTHCRNANHMDTACNKQMVTLDKYTENWLISREAEIDSYHKKYNENYPVFFVNAHGGGIRATIWTTMVLGRLDQEMRADTAMTNKYGFQHYAFSYSGSSGGTVGLMLLTASRYAHLKNAAIDTLFYPARSWPLYSTDNLTSDVIALLGRDMVYGGLGLSGIPDRGRLMEMDWEQNTRNQDTAVNLKLPFRSLWKGGQTEVPLLFSNTYDIISGNKGIVAPVALDTADFPSVVFLEQEIPGRGDLRLSTAGFLSARFPYVSPTGKWNNRRHFTDAGTIENSGGETSLQVIKVFERVRERLAATHQALRNININILSLPNSIANVESPAYDRSFYEPLGPPLGALNVGSANSDRAELINRRLPKPGNGYFYFSFQPAAYKFKEKPFWPVLPLGWQISNAALEALQYNAIKPASKMDTILKVFRVKRKMVK